MEEAVCVAVAAADGTIGGCVFADDGVVGAGDGVGDGDLVDDGCLRLSTRLLRVGRICVFFEGLLARRMHSRFQRIFRQIQMVNKHCT